MPQEKLASRGSPQTAFHFLNENQVQAAHCSDNTGTLQVHEPFRTLHPSIVRILTWPFPEEPLTGRSSLRRAEPSALVVFLGRGPYLRGKGPASYAEAEAKAGSPLLPQAPLLMGHLRPGSLARNEPLPSPVRGLFHALSRGIPVSLWPHRLLARRPQRHVSQSDLQVSAGFVDQTLSVKKIKDR